MLDPHEYLSVVATCWEVLEVQSPSTDKLHRSSNLRMPVVNQVSEGASRVLSLAFLCRRLQIWKSLFSGRFKTSLPGRRSCLFWLPLPLSLCLSCRLLSSHPVKVSWRQQHQLIAIEDLPADLHGRHACVLEASALAPHAIGIKSSSSGRVQQECSWQPLACYSLWRSIS